MAFFVREVVVIHDRSPNVWPGDFSTARHLYHFTIRCVYYLVTSISTVSENVYNRVRLTICPYSLLAGRAIRSPGDFTVGEQGQGELAQPGVRMPPYCVRKMNVIYRTVTAKR